MHPLVAEINEGKVKHTLSLPFGVEIKQHSIEWTDAVSKVPSQSVNVSNTNTAVYVPAQSAKVSLILQFFTVNGDHIFDFNNTNIPVAKSRFTSSKDLANHFIEEFLKMMASNAIKMAEQSDLLRDILLDPNVSEVKLDAINRFSSDFGVLVGERMKLNPNIKLHKPLFAAIFNSCYDLPEGTVVPSNLTQFLLNYTDDLDLEFRYVYGSYIAFCRQKKTVMFKRDEGTLTKLSNRHKESRNLLKLTKTLLH